MFKIDRPRGRCDSHGVLFQRSRNKRAPIRSMSR
jgi:hypothetical protein